MLVRGLAVAAAVVILDQLSKAAVLGHFAGDAFVGERITPFFNLVLVYNRGVSFGLFNAGAGSDVGFNALLFSLVAAVVVVGLVYWLRRVSSPLLSIAIGLIVGGAIGNVVDRIRLGAVVDFLDFHIALWHWPAFNFADSAICVGIAAMLLDGLLLHREAR
ncbi:MAG TPA: signal peptidase II [Stellaceae bacterium]|jgi:signal peptidase II